MRHKKGRELGSPVEKILSTGESNGDRVLDIQGSDVGRGNMGNIGGHVRHTVGLLVR